MDYEEEHPPTSGGQSSTGASESRMIVSSFNRSKRSKRSSIWNSFKIEKMRMVKKGPIVRNVQKNYLWLPHSGTTNLLRHFKKCSMDVERKEVKIDDKIAREKFSRVIIRHNLPFLAVEYEELRDYLNYLNPDYKFKTWEKVKLKLKSELEKILSMVCLTSDCWTTPFGDGYIVLTAHYVDAKWILNSKILSFCDMLPPHTGDVLAIFCDIHLLIYFLLKL